MAAMAAKLRFRAKLLSWAYLSSDFELSISYQFVGLIKIEKPKYLNATTL